MVDDRDATDETVRQDPTLKGVGGVDDVGVAETVAHTPPANPPTPGLTTKRPVKSRTATPSLNVHLISTVVTFNLSRLAAGCVIAEGLHTRSNDAGAGSQRGALAAEDA